MNRRAFLFRASAIAAGAVAADQIELLDRLGWTRRLFPGFSTINAMPFIVRQDGTFRWGQTVQGISGQMVDITRMQCRYNEAIVGVISAPKGILLQNGHAWPSPPDQIVWEDWCHPWTREGA